MSNIPERKLSEFERIHFVGVGGIGMSALARLCLNEGKHVSGSDRSPSDITRALEKEGVRFYSTQEKENITDSVDLVVFTEAMPHDHEELVAAREKGIVLMNYFEALSMVANEYYLIAVAGTHGKTTTTAMLIDIFENAGMDPSAIVGSLRASTKSNYRHGKSKYMIVEACEYKRDFLSLTPDVLVITNIEYEHVDYYKNLADVQMAFQEFAQQVREGGVVMLNFGGANMAPVLEGLRVSIVDYGKYFNPTLSLRVPGVHNQLNAAAARAVATYIGIDEVVIDDALRDFRGTWRRFEYKGEVGGAKVYDDYGHHPTEIQATLQGARELYPERKITLIFQPHTYSRTYELFTDFARVLGLADRVILAPIYAAREENVSGVTHHQLAEAVGDTATAIDTIDDIPGLIKVGASENDLILVMGAGDITKVSTELIS